MLPNSLVLPTPSDATGATSATFERITEGRWMESTTTLDEPTYLEIKSQVSAERGVQVVARISFTRNRLGLPDRRISVHTVMAADTGFLNSELTGCIRTLDKFLLTSDTLTRLLRGER